MKEVLGGVLVGGGLKKREWTVVVVNIGLDDAVGVRGDREGLKDIFLLRLCSSA